MSIVALKDVCASVRCPNEQVFKSETSSPCRVKLAGIVQLLQFINDLTTVAHIIVSTAGEKHSIDFTKFLQHHFIRLIHDEGNDSCSCSLHKLDIGSQYVRVSAFKSRIMFKIRVQRLRNNTDYGL